MSAGTRQEDTHAEQIRQRLLAGTPLAERHVLLAGVRTVIYEAGDGPPMILLHGQGEPWAVWMGVLDDLVRTHHVIVVDLPGHGASTVVDGKLDAERASRWFDELIEATCSGSPIVAVTSWAARSRPATRWTTATAWHTSYSSTRWGSPGTGHRSGSQSLARFLARPTPSSRDRLFNECFVDFERGGEQFGRHWDDVRDYALDCAQRPAAKAAMNQLLPRVGVPPDRLRRSRQHHDVLAALPLGPGVRVPDSGAGSGALAIPAARMGANVVAVDIAPVMVERLAARADTEGLDNLDACVGDGTALDLDDDSFDVTVSLNGVSVFPDLFAGLTEMARVTRPGGKVVVAAFGPLPEVELVAFFLGALRAVTPDAVPPPARPLPPFRLADPTVFRRTLEEAGLHEVVIETATWETTTFGSVDDHLALLMSSSLIAGQLAATLTDEQSEQFRLVLDGMLRERSGGGSGATLRSTMRIGHAVA